MASGISPSSHRRAVQASLVRSVGSRESLFWRSTFFMLVITTLMSVCVLRLAQMQLVEGPRFQQLAEENRIRPIPIPADRGNIVDRNGNLLASNRLSRGVYLWPRQQSPAQWQQSAERLGTALDIPPAEIIDRLEKTGYNSPLPVRIVQQISPTAFVALAEQASDLPGVEIIAGSTRQYPHAGLAAHVLGYIGEATEADMKANPHYPNGVIVGQMGVERMANDQLIGKWGNRLIEVDARGQELRLLNIEPAESGQDVRLTLDLKLQQAAERALNGRRGSVAVLDVNTGGVLALASAPTFDPNLFTQRVTEADWQRLQEGDQPFLNRALQGYPPGSTFKIVTAAAGMQSGQFFPDSVIMTSAFISLGGIQFWEHSRHGYGAIGLREALAVSSNTFFYHIGLAVGPEQIAASGKALGIGTSDVGLEGNSPGMIPTPEEKEKLFNEPWYGGDTVSMSIGQGLVQASPLELAVMVAAIANGGWRVKPHLLADQSNTPEMEREATGLTPDEVRSIQAGLVAAVQSGTAQRLNDGKIPLSAGKTGTSEVVGRPSHALFVGYAPAENPQLAIAVIVENGGFGGVTAVPIAHEVYKAYFGVPAESEDTGGSAQP